MNMFGCLTLLVSGELVACSAGQEEARTDPVVLERPGEPPVSSISVEDEEMNIAMKQARLSLDEYEQRLAKPPAAQTYLGLKGRFEADGVVEHMWVSDVVVTAQGFRGNLSNEPLHMPSMKSGQAVLLPRERVSDWMAVEDGRLVGGYTLRLLRARMTEEERAEFDANAAFQID